MKMRRWGWRYSELYCEVHPTSAKIPTEDVASWCLGLINISCFAPEKSLWYSEADLQRRIRRLSGCSAHRCSGFLLLQVGSHRHRETPQQKKKIMIFLWWNVSIKLMDKRLNLWDLFSSISFVSIFLSGSCSARATTSTSTCSRPSSSGVWLCSSKIQCCLQTKARITAPCPRWGCSTVRTRLLHIY